MAMHAICITLVLLFTDQSAIEPGMIIAVPLVKPAAALIYGRCWYTTSVAAWLEHCLWCCKPELKFLVSQLGALSTQGGS